MRAEASAEQRRWPALRWCSLISLIFGLQLAFIFWLSDRTPVARRAEAPVPVLCLAGRASAEFLALGNPTWFALPHRQGFSGLAWMKVPEPEFHGFSYTNQPAWLPLPSQQPVSAFYEFIRTNDFGSARPLANTELALTLPELVPLPLSRERSVLRLEGELAGRALLSRFELNSWRTNGAVLANSVVQVVVDAAGWPQSTALLKGSGSAEADQEALARTAVARFAPLADASNAAGSSSARLTRGLMVYEWHTLPLPSSSAATAGP